MLTTSLAVGVVVSVLFTELIGLVPGGIIIPGYVAVILNRPAALLLTLLLTLATYVLVSLLARVVVLYGSRRFAVTVLIGLALSSLMQLLRPSLGAFFLEWTGIGYIVPGLIAHQFFRQGVVRTLLAIAITAPIVRLIVLAIVG